MKEKTLTEHLLNYLKEHQGDWVKKVQLYVIADELGYSPETCGRYLRELSEDKPNRKAQIKVSYYDGKHAKHLAQYSYDPKAVKTRHIEVRDGVAYIFYA